jgi:hypothetical protein
VEKDKRLEFLVSMNEEIALAETVLFSYLSISFLNING